MKTYTLPQSHTFGSATPLLALALWALVLPTAACAPDDDPEAAAVYGPRGAPTTTDEDLSLLPVDAGAADAPRGDAGADTTADPALLDLTDAGGSDVSTADTDDEGDLASFFDFAGLDATGLSCPGSTVVPVGDALVIEDGLRRLSDDEVEVDYACIQRVGALDVCGNVRLVVAGDAPVVLGGGGVGVTEGARASLVVVAPLAPSVFLKGFCGTEDFTVSVFAPRADVTLTCAGAERLVAFVRARSVAAYAQGPVQLDFSASVKDGPQRVEEFSLIPSEPACPLRR